MGDEFRTDSLSCYGTPHPSIRTPNIDRIARQGVTFTNCFCNSPICVPSRTSEMTANPPEVTGVYGNEGSWASYRYERELLSFPQHFAAHGYRTINFGKTHLPVALRPWQEDDHVGADLAGFFDGVDPAGRQILTPTLKAAIGGTFPGPVEFPGNKLTRAAVEWLDSGDAAKQPFLARVSYLQPHSPVMPPAPYDELYRHLDWPDRIEGGEPGSAFEQRFVDVMQAAALSPEELRRVRSDYYGLVAWLDDQVGAILDALERSGLSENTIIVLEADHGVSLAERGRLQKHTFFPEVHRIPRLIAWPGLLPRGQVRSDLCESMDLAKTLCGLCGIEPAATFQGRNLFADAPPDHVFSTVGYGETNSYALPNQVVGTWSDGTGWPRRTCVRTSRYRLDMTVRRNGAAVPRDEEDPFLADLALDPLEAVNRAADPTYAAIVEELRSLILAHTSNSFEPAFVPTYSDVGRGAN
jgi:choline-sulfatase